MFVPNITKNETFSEIFNHSVLLLEGVVDGIDCVNNPKGKVIFAG